MMGAIGPYTTLPELLGTRAVVSDLLRELSKIPRSDVLRCLAGLSTLINRESSNAPQEQRRILHYFVPLDIVEKIEEARAGQPVGALFFRRQLWFLWQMALIACKDDSTMEHNQETQRQVGYCCLLASEVMKDVETAQPLDPHEARTLRFIATTLISHADPVTGSEVIARCQLFWLELQQDEEIKRLLKRHGLKPVAQSFEDAYGIPLVEFIRFSMTLYIKFVESTLNDPPSALMFDSTQAFKSYFSTEHMATALKLMSIAPDKLASKLFGLPRQSWAFDTTVLLKAPLLEVAPNRYVCFDLHIYRAFLVQGIFELLADAVGYEGMKMILGGLFESYIDRLMLSFAPKSSVLVTPYFNNVVFESDKTQEGCDGLLLWSSFAVLLECKTNMLTSRQRYAMNFSETMKGIDDQIATFSDPGDQNSKKRKGIGQIAFNLNRILSGEKFKSDGKAIDLSAVPKFHPAVVLYDDDIVNHAVRLHLHTEMTKWFDKHGIDRSRIGQTLLFSLKDVEYLALLSENKSVEAVLGEYIAFIDQNPIEVQSLFHEFAIARYPKESRSSRGYTLGTSDRVLKELQDELTCRKAKTESA